jgi:hypothetical protein
MLPIRCACCCSATYPTLYRSVSLSSVRVYEINASARMGQSVWAVVSPKLVRLAYHLSGCKTPEPHWHAGAHGELLYSHLPSGKTVSRLVPRLGVPRRFVCVSVFWGQPTPVVLPRELQDEETPFVPTLRPSVCPLPLSCCISVSLCNLAFQMHVSHLFPGQLAVPFPSLWLPRHRS